MSFKNLLGVYFLAGFLVSGLLLFSSCKTSQKTTSKSTQESSSHTSESIDSTSHRVHFVASKTNAEESEESDSEWEITGPAVISPDGTITATSPETTIKNHTKTKSTKQEATTQTDSIATNTAAHITADSTAYHLAEVQNKNVTRTPPYGLYIKLSILIIFTTALLVKHRKKLFRWLR